MRRAFALLLACAWGTAFAQPAPAKAPPPASAGQPAKAVAPEKKVKPPLDVGRLPFSPESLRQVVAYHQDGIQACYEEWLAGQQQPSKGSLMASFTILPSGAVREARILKQGTTLSDGKLQACVVAVLEAMRFPKPEDGEELLVEFPFNLKPIP
ncbi:MAG TPA: AgmX/PglI C-terminal domain-containing protein [Myxococcaceae bacterium]|nr:AgmX/PglI C-terminal domain-containing protein [Myxococcaceae bacterium]